MGTGYVLDQGIDATTWQALGLVLTLTGLLVSVLVWRRAGPARGLRLVAWSLVPLAAALTGLLRLGWEILDSVLSWAARLVFSPIVWLGLVVAVIALVLYLASGILLRRSAQRPSGSSRSAAPGELSSSSRPTGDQPGGRSPGRSRRQQGELVEDQDDIEAILRKHGIS